jgi:hypothetical protein
MLERGSYIIQKMALALSVFHVLFTTVFAGVIGVSESGLISVNVISIHPSKCL